MKYHKHGFTLLSKFLSSSGSRRQIGVMKHCTSNNHKDKLGLNKLLYSTHTIGSQIFYQFIYIN